ncbi:class I SAM-dependent methyltransferase [Ruminiclostridium papyrosolvens]|uniref:SAM-dependent methyltransferase n=1 Tax=Ruminiclostridium papyrosolvens C7 TaxID=1330534 RepID=U4R2C7_9FIRM|nr:class I SAM-dependent methyltransferase [Ruminiclostridium papyrosolvens]EPR11710.1 SAM-dependent methyltransferase [Ruminiclostridium papyrosolvens C7]
MLLADEWKEYELIETGDGEKLERWGNVILRRPDPQIIWPIKDKKMWDKADAHYHRSQSGGGQWEFKKKVPKRWTVSFNELKFYIEPTGFKHTGLFPEQAVNWKWMINSVQKANRPIRVLNLFAYTGGATVATAYAGAEVCHVDASKGMVSWAKENLALSGLADRPVRFITDDCMKFVQREIRRGKKYDGIIMDPPSYGRGPGGEIWKIEDSLYGFVEQCMGLLSDKPLFFLINSYTTGFSPTVLSNILKQTIGKRFKGTHSSGEVGIPVSNSGLVLPCGIYGRWENR